MARSNVNINHINATNDTKRSGKKLTSLPLHILALFVVLCCSDALPVVATTVVGKRADSSTEAVVDAAGDEDVGVAKRSAEDLQLPHVFRHQEHYSHRIEQVVNDLKRTQLQQQLSGNYSNTTANNVDGSVNSDNSGTSDNYNNNNYMHYQSQLQPRMSEHLRHHNQRHHSLAPVNGWERYLLPPLRHQRHQQERQQNLQPEYVADATLVVTTAPLMPLVAPTATEAANEAAVVATTNQQGNILPVISRSANGSSAQQHHKKPHRYFDRDGLYQTSSYIWTTRGPRVRSDANYWKTKDFPSTHLSGGKQTDSQRISLNLNADSEDEPYLHESGVQREKYKSSEARGNIGADNDSEVVNDDIDSSSDDYEDYSYEEDSTEAVQSANDFPNVNNMYDGEHRSAVKRYTNPFNDLRLPPKKRDYSPHPYMSLRRRVGTVLDGNVGNAYANFGVDSVDDNSESDFSSEKWQRIQQEHHRKQQEHQRQMMALRARHDGKHRGTAAAATATPLIMAAASVPATQQRQNDDVSAVFN